MTASGRNEIAIDRPGDCEETPWAATVCPVVANQIMLGLAGRGR
jgi:hypothetical protein